MDKEKSEIGNKENKPKKESKTEEPWGTRDRSLREITTSIKPGIVSSNRIVISYWIPPFLHKKVNYLIDKGLFSSYQDFIDHAIIHFIDEINQEDGSKFSYKLKK
ncbi:MAG: hypothetical protein ACP5NU_01200 [Methanomicrobiales archaeon]